MWLCCFDGMIKFRRKSKIYPDTDISDNNDTLYDKPKMEIIIKNIISNMKEYRTDSFTN